MNDCWTRSDFDLPAIASRSSRRWSEAIESSTSAATRARALDNCRASARDVGACDFHCRCDSVASNIDRKKLLRNQLPSVDWAEFDSSRDRPDCGAAIGDAEAIEYCIVMLKQKLRKLGLKHII